MSGLRQAADRLRRLHPYPILTLERLFAIQRAGARLEGRRLDTGERTAEMRGLRASLAAILRGGPGSVSAIVAAALAQKRRSIDRAIVRAYLDAMPGDHAEFEALRAAAAIAAGRHDWQLPEEAHAALAERAAGDQNSSLRSVTRIVRPSGSR